MIDPNVQKQVNCDSNQINLEVFFQNSTMQYCNAIYGQFHYDEAVIF